MSPIPKLYRARTKDGKETGNWCVRLNGKPVNLKTQDYFKARERAQLAVDGELNFTDDKTATDSYSVEVPKDTEPSKTSIASDWTTDATKAASAGITPDAYFPPGLPPISETPPSTDAPPSSAPQDTKPGIGDESTSLPPEMMNGLITQIAQTVVELQIQGQEYLAIRWGKIQPGTVPPDSKARELPQKIWEEQIRKWIPTDVPLPAWVVAPVLCAMLTIPIQLEGATPIKKE